mmetsp:Transcript_35509/g.81987  ORF Transcript_35509/g.81987 Transcript_35509/m.81987 type:complete len:203 (-) Transcript_35509:115-723(-)
MTSSRLDEDVDRFIGENPELSQHSEAVRTLQRLSPAEKQAVLRKGTMSGSRDPVAVIKARAKQAVPRKHQLTSTSLRQHRHLWITNLSPQTTAFDLHAVFCVMEGLVAVRLLRNKDAPEAAQAGLCEFRSPATAKTALKEAQGIELLGSSLALKPVHNTSQLDFDAFTLRPACAAPSAEATALDAAQDVFVPKGLRRQSCNG